MEMAKRVARDIGGEAIKALAVLALVFLSFAHQPVAVAQADDGPQWAVSDLSYCGGAPDGEAGHLPCHACRAGVADLPPAPSMAEPAYVAFAETGFALVDDFMVGQRGFSPANPRAPPAGV